MKTAISLPDRIYFEAERKNITQKLNEVYNIVL